MQQEWKEFEIKDFLGKTTKRNPTKQECSELINLDPRGTKGDLIAVAGNSAVYSAPTPEFFVKSADLGAAFLYLSEVDADDPREITVSVQKGRISPIAGSGADISSKFTTNYLDTLAISIRPYWDGAQWIDGWDWLNKIVITRIATESSFVYTFTSVSSMNARYVIYNVTKDEWATRVYSSGASITLSRDDWEVDDTVMIMSNHYALDYIQGIGETTIKELVFHKVLNDLRIGFGSYEDRLGIGVGHRKKYWHIDTVAAGAYTSNTNGLNQIVMSPYNIIAEDDTYDFNVTTIVDTTSPLNSGIVGERIFIRVTAMLDKFQEFLVYDSYKDLGAADTHTVKINPQLSFATINPRLTALRFYVARSSTEDKETVMGAYMLVKELEVAGDAVGTGWTLSAADILYRTDFGFVIDNAMIEASKEELNDKLGYTATTDYVKSWDRAITANGRTFLMNPFDSKKWTNRIFGSAISGAPANMYDVITSELYFDVEMRDGNDIVTLDVLQNLDFLALKQNSNQIISTTTGRPREVAVGYGTNAPRGVVNIGGKIVYPSKYDMIMTNGVEIQNLSENTIRDEYQAITDKTAIIAAREEKVESYRMFTGSYEYVFVPGFGWFKSDLEDDIIQYLISENGELCYLDSDGDLRKFNNSVIPTGNCQWESIPFNISLMGEGLKGTNRILVGYVWAKYQAANNFTISISIDGGAYGNSMTFSKDATYAMKKTPIIRSSSEIKIKLVAPTTAADSKRFRLQSIGLMWKALRVGQWG